MQLKMTAQGFDLTEGLKEHIQLQMERLTKFDHSAHISNAHVILHATGHGGRVLSKAEGQVSIAGPDAFAEAEDEDLYKAVDKMVERLHTQLKKVHEKTVKKARGGKRDFILE